MCTHLCQLSCRVFTHGVRIFIIFSCSHGKYRDGMASPSKSFKKENNENDMAAQVFWAGFYSSQRPSPTADFNSAAIPPPIFSMSLLYANYWRSVLPYFLKLLRHMGLIFRSCSKRKSEIETALTTDLES